MLNNILILFAGLGALLVGFKLLSDNTAKLADTGLRTMFNKTSKNPLIGVLIGAGATAIIQSSGATTVMIVGFVNSGIMSLYQATAMIMGANIGTTITGQIASLKSLPVAEFAMALTLVGMSMEMFAKKDKVKSLGLLFAGLGLIFVGLELMSSSMTEFSKSDAITEAFRVINNPLLLLFIGVVTTGIVQSSSAITSILITMASSGLAIGGGGNAILFVVLGTNIGSTVTALMSSFSANTNGKRTSLIHLLFNTVGSLIFFIILILWKDFMSVTFASWFVDPGVQIAMFHTFFNLICTVLFIPFINVFVWVATKIYKDKEMEKARQSHLDSRVLRTPAIALQCVKREIIDACKMAIDIFDMAITNFINKDCETNDQVRAKIGEVNDIGKSIVEYVVKISSGDTSYHDEQEIGKIHYVVGDVVRVADIADNIVRHAERAAREDLVFSDGVKEELRVMANKIIELYQNVAKAYANEDKSLLPAIDAIEETIDQTRRKLVHGHIERLSEGKCHPNSSGVFINLVANLERIGDHLNSIGHSIETIHLV